MGGTPSPSRSRAGSAIVLLKLCSGSAWWSNEALLSPAPWIVVHSQLAWLNFFTFSVDLYAQSGKSAQIDAALI